MGPLIKFRVIQGFQDLLDTLFLLKYLLPYTSFFINNQKFKQSPQKSLIC